MAEELKTLRDLLSKKGFNNIEVSEYRDSIVLNGKLDKWDKKIKAGYLATKIGYKGVINDISVDGITEQKFSEPYITDDKLEGEKFDAVIIGGGVVGTSIARELSKYKLKIALMEKDADVAMHSSGRNDGMIHPGFAPKPKSKKAYYNIKGNELYTNICKELGIKLKRPGSIILFKTPFTKILVPYFKMRSKSNNVNGYCYLSKKKVKEMEPHVTDLQQGGFFLPSAGILSPYRVTIAFAENAIENGVNIYLNTLVQGFVKENNTITKIKTNRGTVETKLVINASGIWSDKIAELADDRFFSIHPRKGMDAILDIKTGKYQTRITGMPSFLQINEKTKGGGLVPTIEGNLLIGPTAEEVPGREDYTTDSYHLNMLLKHLNLNKMLKKSDIITYFSGTRACTYEEDFIVEKSEYVNNLVHAAGIQSPGLASAPAIAEDIVKFSIDILKKSMEVKLNEKFNPYRKTTPELNDLSYEERSELIKKTPLYGRIICRCESISEGEVRDALKSPLLPTTLDALKRRSRVSTGRCHGGFCTPRLLEIISEETNIKITEIKKKGGESSILLDETKGNIDYSNKTVKTKK